MIRRPATLGGATLAFLLIAGSPLQANLIHWSYSWSRSPSVVTADSPGTGSVSLTDESELRSVVGDSNIVATNLRTHSDATPLNPDRFTNKSYSLALLLRDEASTQTGTVTFTGQLDGTLTAGSANLDNTFTGETTQIIVLGTTRFEVTIGPFASPGPPGTTNVGSISAQAQVRVAAILQIPEPGTWVLASLGAAVLGLGGWYRSRQRQRHRALPAPEKIRS
jgi:hypothetical protein